MAEEVTGGTDTGAVAGGAADTNLPAAAGGAGGAPDPKATGTALTGKTDAPADDAANKPEDAKGDDGKGAPVDYDFKAPEGFEVNDEQVTAFKEVLKGINEATGTVIPKEAAQKLFDMHAEALIKAEAAANTMWETTVEGWRKEAKADPEIGGNNFDGKVALANKALKAFGDKDGKLVQLLTDNGSGDHVEMIRFCAKIGAAMSEAEVQSGAPAPGKPKDLASRLFPNDAPKT